MENNYLKPYKPANRYRYHIYKFSNPYENVMSTVPIFEIDRRKRKIREGQKPTVACSSVVTKPEFERLRGNRGASTNNKSNCSLNENFFYMTKNQFKCNESRQHDNNKKLEQ